MSPPSVLLRSPVFMNLRRSVSAQRGAPRRVPHRCMSDLLRNCSPTEGESTASCQDDKHGQEMTRQPVRWWVFKAWLGCPMGKKNQALKEKSREPGGASAHRRPGYSSSGCTPAEPDFASPGEGNHSRTGPNRARSPISHGWTIRRSHPARIPDRTRRLQMGKDTPEESKNKDSGVPVENMF
jgi:hypothetical protein